MMLDQKYTDPVSSQEVCVIVFDPPQDQPLLIDINLDVSLLSSESTNAGIKVIVNQ